MSHDINSLTQDSIQLIDTHAHLADESLFPDLYDVLQRAAGVGVVQMVAVGTTLSNSRICLELAKRHPQLYASVGIHPNYCTAAGPTDWEQIVELSTLPRVVALGETGLDCYWQDVPLDLQRDYFERHLALSRVTGLPVIIHMRESGPQILQVLADAARIAPVKGVMHSFSGDRALADACLDLGLYISFSGMLTFKKSVGLREIAACIPDDRILIETDCPYLSPEPIRGKHPNEPARVRHTAQCLADARGVSVDTLAQITTSNARTLFQLKET
ncbi:MAG: TatD family hydrolase [Planctomycetota bacterium]|nr:TatD family hydrolase [Planctomycetota bacterium]MDA1177622.1 TatD family hydrolase [Planctomycetota bacterium]